MYTVFLFKVTYNNAIVWTQPPHLSPLFIELYYIENKGKEWLSDTWL